MIANPKTSYETLGDRTAKGKTAELWKSEPQNFEGWFRFAHSKIHSIHPFDIGHSIFIIRYSFFISSAKLQSLFASVRLLKPAVALKPEHCNPNTIFV